MAKRGEKLEGKKLEQIHEAAKSSWSEEARAKRKANLALNRMLGTTAGERRHRLTPEVQEHIREAMLEMNKETKHPFYMDFIDNFLTEAKTNPNSQAGQRLASIIFGQDMLQALDEEVNKQMKRDQGFAEYQIRKTLYDKQQEVFDNRQDNFIVIICTRRAGKTELDARLLARAVLEPNTPCLYINRTFDNAVNQLGRPLCNVLDELKMTYSGRPGGGILHFPNGSSVTFGGFANKGQIDVYRGGKYKVVIIDEIGHLRNADMLLKEVIEPAMIDFGKQKQLILTGTPPRTKASYAYQIWHSDGIKKYHWSFMDNPFIPDKETVIDEACKRHGVNEDAPFIQREYYGNMEAFDTDALIFKGYTTYDKLPQGRTWSHSWVGVDWGFEDKAAVVSMVADRAKKEMYIVNVWSEAKRGTSEQCEIVKQFVDELNQLPHSWGNVQVVCDTNDKQGSYDLYHQYHIPNVTNAYKYDRDMSIEQLAEWLRTGTIKVPKKDNELTNDLEYSIWERDDETDELKHELSDEYHPNAAMALLYASRQFAYYVLGLVETNKPAKHITSGLYPEETAGGTDD